MRLLFRSLAGVLSLVTSAAHAQEMPIDSPGADAFRPGSGRVWLSGCTYESERYVACNNAARPVLDAIAKSGDATPGAALQAFMRQTFTEKGCTFDAPAETFRVNGIFLSFDAKAASEIRCAGKKSGLVFAPGVITFLDTLYFLSGDPPQ